jgi:hypothetical protein
MPRRLHSITVALAVLLACGAVQSVISEPASKIEFNRDVRPILSDNCFRCHGPDKNNRKAKLRLDVREVALEKEAFVPGKPNESELVSRINTTNLDDLMPPPDTHKMLTKAQKKLLADWIAQGAEYQPHWAYIVPKRPAVPETKNSEVIRNPIDGFILKELAARKIKSSPEADRRTLLRRLSLDLIGLPPTPEEVEAFVNDKSPNAYEKQVDRLLGSPHYGERMAVQWLDLARYADTVGYHGDQNQNVFPYRDYVINSFNANRPFDQFTIEQLAGDLLPNATDEQKTASCFNRLNMVTREGGAQPKEYLAKYAGDRVRTVSTTWLGSTMACCECHDHKYDPFTTKDFYSLGAFFADMKQWGVYADYSYTPNPDLRGVGNDHPFPPEIEVDSPPLRKRIQKLRAEYADAQTKVRKQLDDKKIDAAFTEWLTASRKLVKNTPDGWLAPHPEVVLKMKNTNALAATNYSIEADQTISFSTQPRENTTLLLPLTNLWLASIRLEVVPRESPNDAKKPMKKKRRDESDITLSATLKSGVKETKLTFHFAEADHKTPRYSAGRIIPGVKDVWRVSTEHENQTAVWQLDHPIKIDGAAILTVNLGSAGVASLRATISPFASENILEPVVDADLRQALTGSAMFRSAAQKQLLQNAFLQGTDYATNFLVRAHAIEREIVEFRGGNAFVQVTESREPMTMRVLPRGNWQDESGEVVQPSPPHFLLQSPLTTTNRLTRLNLARWIVSPENPLTARTFVNRMWKNFFGTGLSAVVDDLGAQGEWPTHPELLDWLACEFVRPENSESKSVAGGGDVLTFQPLDATSAWNVKHIIKLMVMSATYRQVSGPRPDLKDIDPNNRLLACQSPRRLEAEMVRDNALAISGLLNEEIGGPSARPYQPAGYYANLQFPDRDYYPDKDERQYRRGVYSWWQRTFLQPMLANFDAPAREECTAARNNSNTPQQALTELNDPTFVEASRVFAGHLLATKTASDEERFNLAFQRALARMPKSSEINSLKTFLAEQREYYGAHIEDAKNLLHVGIAPEPSLASESELAAWTQVCRVVLNLHETITKY